VSVAAKDFEPQPRAAHCVSHPSACPPQNYFGRKIAVDASMHIYSFLVRSAALQLPLVAVPPVAFDVHDWMAVAIAAWWQSRLVHVASSGCMFVQSLGGVCIPGSLPLAGACPQVVVGRQGDQLLTSEAGDVTRCAPTCGCCISLCKAHCSKGCN